MKTIILRSILFFSIFFFQNTLVTASNIDSEKLFKEANNIFISSNSCQKELYEKKIGEVLLFAQKEFSVPIEQLRNDKVLTAKQMASKTVEIFREYKQSLDIICQNIVQSCAVKNTQLDELENFSACQDKANVYKKIQQISLSNINQENAFEKALFFLRERARVFEKKMHAWFVPEFRELTNNVENMVAKISTLVKQPE